MDGRNLSALRAVIAGITDFPHSKRSVVYSAEEDRRDIDLVNQGEQLGTSFDRVILCEIEKGVDRPVGEVTRLLRAGVEKGTRAKSISEIRDWSNAVDTGWRELQPGELLLIQSSTVPKTVKKLQTMLGLELAEETSNQG